jgi:hypothetical protein
MLDRGSLSRRTGPSMGDGPACQCMSRYSYPTRKTVLRQRSQEEIVLDIQSVVRHFDGVQKASNGWAALCPIHGDKNPSLAITEGDDGRTLLFCHGCSNDAEAIAKAVGLEWSDLFLDDGTEQRIRANRPKTVAKKATDKRKPFGKVVDECWYTASVDYTAILSIFAALL